MAIRAQRFHLMIALVLLASCNEVEKNDESSFRLPDGAHWLEDGPDHWSRRGYQELVPAILPPSISGERVRVLVRLEPNHVITVDIAGELKFPPGAELVRVEERERNGRFEIVDVRGTRIDASGETFRAYRPALSDRDEYLFGFEWQRGNSAAQEEVVHGFNEAMSEGVGFSIEEPGFKIANRKRASRRFASILDCASCHQRVTPERSGLISTLHRATDASGFYVPRYVLRNRAPLETYRPLETNHSNAFVHVRCQGFEPDRFIGSRTSTTMRCPSTSADTSSRVELELDMAGAFRAQNAHALRVCRSRLTLARHFDAKAREQFRDPLRECRSSNAAN